MYPTQTAAQLKTNKTKTTKQTEKEQTNKKQTKTIREVHVGGLVVFTDAESARW